MNAGSPKIVVRLPAETIDRIKEIVDRLNRSPVKEPYTVSSWCRKAILAEIHHLDRSDRLRKIDVVSVRLEEIE